MARNFLQGICRHCIQTLHDCCFGPSRAQKGRWLTLTYFQCHRGQTFPLHILHGFHLNFYRIVAKIGPYTLEKDTAVLELLSRSQQSNFTWPVTLFSEFLQGICRHSIQTSLDCCLGPLRVQKGRWLTLIDLYSWSLGSKKDTAWNFTNQVGAASEFVHKPWIIFLVQQLNGIP